MVDFSARLILEAPCGVRPLLRGHSLAFPSISGQPGGNLAGTWRCCVHPGLEDSKCEDACLVPFPPILTILQRLLLNPGCQEKLGKLQRGFGPSKWPLTLVTWGRGLKAWGSGVQVGRSCRDGGPSSDKPATKALPGLESPIIGLKVPLSLAGELLTGSPDANHCPCPLVAVLVLKLQPALPVGCTGSPGEETRTSEGAGSLVLHCLMPQPCPSPQPQTTWGGVGWCQAFQVKLFFMAR